MSPSSIVLLVVVALSFSLSTVRGAEGTESFDPKKALESISKDLLKGISGSASQRKEAIDAADQKLKERYREQTATLRFTVRGTNKSNGRYYAYAETDRVRVSGTNFTVSFSAYLDESENEKGAKLKVGDRITASGKVFVNLYGSSGSGDTYFSISVNGAKLK